MSSYRTLLTVMLCTLLVGGCSLLGKGEDANRLTVKNKCAVELDHLGKVTGLDKVTLMESVKVEPDCTITIQVTDAIAPIEAGQEEPVVDEPEENTETK